MSLMARCVRMSCRRDERGMYTVLIHVLCQHCLAGHVNYHDDEHRGLSLPSGDGNQLTSVPPAFMALTGWRNIIGVVDSTPPKSDLVRLGFNETLISEPLNIHRGHTIIIRPVATVRAVVFVQSLIPVRFAYCAAFRAGLTRMTWVNRDD